MVRTMKSAATLLASLLLGASLSGAEAPAPAPGAPVEISVGGTAISIPVPPGFEQLTPDLQPAYDFAQRFVYETNQEFVLFLPADQIAAAKDLKIPDLDRKLSVQVEKDEIPRFIANDRFAAKKQTLKAFLKDAVAQVEAKAPGSIAKIEGGLGADEPLDSRLAAQQVISLPPHDEGDRRISFSMLVVVNNEGPAGTVSTGQLAGTVTHLHVKGKYLVLYAMGTKSDLAWSRATSQSWVAAVLAANPSSPETAKAEAAPTPSDTHWTRMALEVTLPVVLAAAAWFVLRKRRKKVPAT